jgi:hypothetical protein
VETLAIAAAVTSVVGVVTKSKELTRIGAGMALGAAGAGVLGLGEAAGTAAGTAAADAGTARAGGSVVGGEAAGSSAAATVAGDAAGAASGAANAGAVTGSVGDASLAGGVPGLPPVDASLAGAPSTGIIGSAANPAAATVDATTAAGGVGAPAGAVAPAGPFAPNAPSAPWSPAGSGVDGAISNAVNSTNPADFTGSSDFFSGSTLDKVGNWVNNNKTLASAMLNLGGGLAQGVASGYAADRNYQTQQDYLNLAKQQAANANAQPKLNFTVNPNVNVFNNPQKTYGGIIAGARGG